MSSASSPARREFLIQSGVATASLAGVSAASAAQSPSCGVRLSEAGARSVGAVSLEQFSAVVGDSFQVYAPTGSAMLRLVSAQAQPCSAREAERPEPARVTPFSLVFEPSVGANLQAGLHEFTHPSLGVLTLSLNAIGDARRQTLYEVVFG